MKIIITAKLSAIADRTREGQEDQAKQSFAGPTKSEGFCLERQIVVFGKAEYDKSASRFLQKGGLANQSLRNRGWEEQRK
ncbi:MAG: hypothetical protein HYT16_04710 [DPANN group archaeon]|nr:hypothetical protein [DPANN group archaeon]